MKKTKLSRRDALTGISTTTFAATLLASFGINADTSAAESYGPVALLSTAELYGECNGEVDILVGNIDPATGKVDNKNILVYGRDLPGTDIYSADYGGHYHEEFEVVYCPKGKIKILIRENSGQGDERLPLPGSDRTYKYIKKTGDKPIEKKLSATEDEIILSRGGWIKIPGRSFHSVIMVETGDLLAFLPDGKRHASSAVSVPPACRR